MAVTNEQLVALYQSTKSRHSKDVLYRKMYKKNIGLIYRITGFYIKTYPTFFRKDQDNADLKQEVALKLADAMDKFKPDRETKFSTYFEFISHNHIRKFLRSYMSRVLEFPCGHDNELSYIEDNKNTNIYGRYTEVLDNLDKKFIRDTILLYVSQIEFKTDKHRFIFESRYGLNRASDGLTLKEIAEAVHLTHQRVSVIIRNYEKKLKKIIDKDIDNGLITKEDIGLLVPQN